MLASRRALLLARLPGCVAQRHYRRAMTAPADEMTKLTIRLPAATHKRIRIAAINQDETVQQLVTEAIEKHLANLQA